MKKIMALLLALMVLLSLAACKENQTEQPTATTTTTTPTKPAEEMEHYDLNEIDLDGIGELLIQRGQEEHCKIRLDGLCTPVVLELEGTALVSITAYGITACVDPAAKEFACIYGNLWPVIYEHEGLILLNIWHDDIGYSCVMCPDSTYMETYPDKDYSVMIYEDEEGRLCQSQFARKFVGIEQWDTGPIDMATSREDFYYSVDDALWTEDGYCVTARESYTISDCFELDEIFAQAKENGLYPEFDTLDELFAYNAQRFSEADDSDNTSNSPDSVREETGYFDQIFLAEDYDGEGNLLTQTYYDCFGEVYFTKNYTYDGLNRETGGSWCFRDEEVYRYINEYSEGDLTETIWYQADQEVERFSYTHMGDGSYTKTFSQNGQKQYTYAFDSSGTLIAHSIYQNGQEIKTQDVTKLVQTQLLTDLWLPPVDNEAQHYPQYYNGTIPAEDPAQWNATPGYNGGRILTQSSVDEENGLLYTFEHHYDQKDRLVTVIYKQENREYRREEYEYVGNICVRQIGYDRGVKEYTCENEYNIDGQLICAKTSYVNPQTYGLSTEENGVTVETEVTYTTRTETYRYNDWGLLVETVIYEDAEERDRITYDYDVNGNILPRLDTYWYDYNVEGKPEGIWLLYEDHAAGMALLRCHTVYVTTDNARQLRDIMRTELSWF